MYTDTYSEPNPLYSRQADQGPSADALGVAGPPNLSRKLVEFLLYATMINSNLILQSGLAVLPGAGGGPVVLAGMLSAMIILMRGDRMPMTVWFALAINILANITEVFGHGKMPLFASGLNLFFMWMANTVMFCYVAQNQAGFRRMLMFFCLLMILAIQLGGVTEGTRTVQRLRVENVGGLYANPNQIGPSGGILCVGLLFWSLRGSKVLRPFLWFLAAVMMYYVFMSVSRAGILVSLCGLSVFLVAAVGTRGIHGSGLVVILACVAGAAIIIPMLTSAFEGLAERAQSGDHSARARMAVYSYETVEDLFDTVLIGRGSDQAHTSVGINAHNSFIYTHMAYGGIAAWVYMAWLMTLSVRLIRMLRAGDFPRDVKLQAIALFGIMLGANLFTNTGYLELPTYLAVGYLEKYTAAYSLSRVRARRRAMSYAANDDLQAYRDGHLNPA